MARKRQTTVLIRGGKGVDETTEGWPTIDEVKTSTDERPGLIIEIDHGVPLRNRGLVPDCRQIFDIDYYLPLLGARFYADLERLVLESSKYSKIYKKLKEKLFREYPFESQNWDNQDNPEESIRVQLVDPHGGGSLIIQGILKFLCACIGRQYDPENDPRDNPEVHTELRVRPAGTKTVSLMQDLLATLAELEPDEIGLACGVFGATGPSVSMVLNEALHVMKNVGIMPVMLVALPETFLTDGFVPPEMAERLSVLVKLMEPSVILSGIGQSGVFWRAMVDHLRDWGELFSNVHAKHLLFKCASALTVCIIPHREDLEARWLMYNVALSDMSVPDAREVLCRYQNSGQVTFKVVPFGKGSGIRIFVNNSKKLKIHEWQELLPALATAQRHSGKGTMRLPVKVQKVVGRTLFGDKKQDVLTEIDIESVPLLQAVAKGIGVNTIDEATAATSYWALTSLEREMLAAQKMQTFEDAFQILRKEFAPAVEAYLLRTIFSKPIFPPTKHNYTTPCQAVAMWAQVNLSDIALPDAIFKAMFAPVDRSAEEAEHLMIAEQDRQQEIQNKAFELLERLEIEGNA